MLKKLKSLWKSFFYKETQLTKGSTFFGSAKQYLNDVTYEQGTEEWKNSMYSFKLVVDRIESNKVYYFSYYIDPEGNQNITKHVRYVATRFLLKDINRLKLIAD